MRRTASIAATLLLAAAPLVAQSREQPNLILSITGGLATGADLWTLPRQLEAVNCGSPGSCVTSNYDTLALGRRVSPGITAIFSGTYFASPHVGYTAEIGYLGLGSEGACGVIGAYSPDAEEVNQQACQNTQGAHEPTSMVAFQGGVTYRFQPLSFLVPYVRVTAGFGLLGNSFVETTANVVAPSFCSGTGSPVCEVSLLDDPNRASATWVATLAIGNTIRMSPAYAFRFELRDFVTSLPVATGGNKPDSEHPEPTAQTSMRTRHFVALTAGFDVILERSHRRRY